MHAVMRAVVVVAVASFAACGLSQHSAPRVSCGTGFIAFDDECTEAPCTP